MRKWLTCLIQGAGIEPTPNRVVSASRPQNFYTAFLTITNPVIAYAGHFMFFPLMSEMRHPKDAKKSAAVLQVFATVFYAVFAIVNYCYLGNDVQSPSFLSLSPKWAKVVWGLFLPNMLIAGALYNHTAAKIIFVRIFRNSDHLHSNTWFSWVVWVGLCVSFNGIGFVLALGVPVCSHKPKCLDRTIDKGTVVLLLPGRHSSCIVCLMVHLRPRWRLLVARHAFLRRSQSMEWTNFGGSERLGSSQKEASTALARHRHDYGRGLHLRCRNVCNV